jgi:glucoside 3-dehydrogenase (cytochrome c) hitch-hiker subunit
VTQVTQGMNRRELLQRVAWLMGGTISAPAVLGVLNGCSPKPAATTGWQPKFLSKEQGAMVDDIAELIVPHTTTPGARDVGVPAFIDVILQDAYPAEDQQRFVSGLKEFDALAQRAHGKPFLQLPHDQRLEILQQVHDEAAIAERKGAEEQEVPPAERKRPFVLMMKELTLLGFFSSQVGATQVLQYVAVPGGFQACIPAAQAGNGKTWATETSLRF